MKTTALYHKEERLNTLSHALGVVLGLLGFVVLWKTHKQTEEWATLSVVIYSISVILLFSASTLYHAVDNPGIKQKLRVLDHISIYFLIAGTYTPVALITLRESRGVLLFFIVWAVVVAGTLLKYSIPENWNGFP
jgi:hemolysin III